MGEPDEFAGKQVTVMGLGRFGGGVGVTRFLVDRGADVLVTDKEPAEKLTKSIAQIQDLVDTGSVQLRLGEHNASDFTTCDLVVVNPAVKPGNRFVRAAEAAGIEVTTQMRLLVQRLPNRLRTIGVTGSAGKSTVTAMIGHVLVKVFEQGGEPSTPSRQAAKSPSKTGKVWVGGNIGGSLLPKLDEIGEDDWVVLELSSFMLERLKKDAHFPGWSPHIAVITNISPNHLDWHGTMQAYVKAKHVIVDYQSEVSGDAAFGGVGSEAFKPPHGNHWLEGQQDILLMSPGLDLRVPGKHNQVNARLMGLAIQEATGFEESDLWDLLNDFSGLPHRLQLVAEHNGVRYFNDSKCTTPEAAMLAIEAFTDVGDSPAPEKGVGSRFSSEDSVVSEASNSKNDSRPLFQVGIHLILGGKDKGSDMTPLAGLASQKCKAVYTIGALGDTIAGLVQTAGEAASAGVDRPASCGGVSWPAASSEVVRCGDLETAVSAIGQRIKPGDVVLLSPACASWDQFENYEQRGERFIELVKQQKQK